MRGRQRQRAEQPGGKRGETQLIHLLVETLDQYFGNVCELDIVFNFHKVYGILDEIILGGEVLETSKSSIISTIKEIEILE